MRVEGTLVILGQGESAAKYDPDLGIAFPDSLAHYRFQKKP